MFDVVGKSRLILNILIISKYAIWVKVYCRVLIGLSSSEPSPL